MPGTGRHADLGGPSAVWHPIDLHKASLTEEQMFTIRIPIPTFPFPTEVVASG